MATNLISAKFLDNICQSKKKSGLRRSQESFDKNYDNHKIAKFVNLDRPKQITICNCAVLDTSDPGWNSNTLSSLML